MTVFNDYLDQNNTTRYAVAEANGVAASAFQRASQADKFENLSSIALVRVAKALDKSVGEVANELYAMFNQEPITLNQLALQVRNYLEQRPGVNIIERNKFENYQTFSFKYYRDNGKCRTVLMTVRIDKDGAPDIRGGAMFGHKFQLIGQLNHDYHCDMAIADMLDQIIAKENEAHPL